jgi:hypothetical protein
MQSFTSIENKVKCAIPNIECCLGELGACYVENFNRGDVKDEDYWKMLYLRNSLKTLDRYICEADCRCGEKKVINPSKTPCLNSKNTISLGIAEIDCHHCLTEKEVLGLLETLKKLCSTCNCNCN